MSRKIGIASLIWGFSILLSRVIGLVREAVIGRVLGGDAGADVFWTSFVIPDFLNYLLAGGALSIVFIPIFSGYLSRDDEAGGWQAFSAIANVIGALLLVALVGLWFALPALVPLVAPGFDAAQAEQLVTLTRIVLPAQVFHILGGLLSAALQARDRHVLPAMAPLVYTSCIIVGGVVGASAEGFAWGVLTGSVLGPFGLVLYGNLRLGMRWHLTAGFGQGNVKTYLWRSVPIMLGFSIVMVDDWILRRQASWLADGSISSLQYAKTLMKVPMGVFGMATGVAAYPTLARLMAGGQGAEAYATLSTAVRRMLVLALGAQVALTCAGTEISQVIYGSRIPIAQHRDIGMALAIFGVGLWAWAAQTVVARGFYAMGRTWLPTIVGSAVALAAYPLYSLGRTEIGLLGLPAATTTAISVYVFILIVLLRRSFPDTQDGYASFFLRIVPATAAGIGAGWGLRQVLALPHPLLQGGALAAVGGGVYLGIALGLRSADTRAMLDIVLRRLRRRRG